jgi:hypothetical protein
MLSSETSANTHKHCRHRHLGIKRRVCWAETLTLAPQAAVHISAMRQIRPANHLAELDVPLSNSNQKKWTKPHTYGPFIAERFNGLD